MALHNPKIFNFTHNIKQCKQNKNKHSIFSFQLKQRKQEMNLHEAIIKILQQKGSPMSTMEIADELNNSGLYKRTDGTDVCNFQVHSRTFNHPDLFVKKGKMIALKNKSNEQDKDD